MSTAKYVGVEPLATYFGVSISTVRQWVRNKKIPDSAYIKVGTTYRFNLAATEEALLNADNPNWTAPMKEDIKTDSELDSILNDYNELDEL